MDRRRAMSTRSIVEYRRTVERFVVDFGDPRKADRTVLNAWLKSIATYRRNGQVLEASASTQNQKIAAIKQLFWFMQDEEGREDNPAESIRYRRVPPRVTEPATMEEVQDIIDEIEKTEGENELYLQDIAMIETFIGTMVRREELIDLRIGRVRPDRMKVIGKGDKERRTIVTDVAYEALRDWCLTKHGSAQDREKAQEDPDTAFRRLQKRKPDEHVFVSTQGKPVAELRNPGNWVYKRVKKFATRAGVERIRPHLFRSGGAVDLLENDVNIHDIQQMLGHGSLLTTQGYLALRDKGLSTAKSRHSRQRRRKRRSA